MSANRPLANLAAVGAAAASLGIGVAANMLPAAGGGWAFLTASLSLVVALLAALPHLMDRWSLAWGPRSSEEEAAVRRLLSSLLMMARTARSGPDFDVLLDVKSERRSVSGRVPGDGSPAGISEMAVPRSSSAVIAELTEDPHCAVITGVRGAGKTALLVALGERMAVNWLQVGAEKRRRTRVPLLLEVAEWGSFYGRKDSFSTRLAESVSHRYGLPTRIVTYWIRHEKASFLLDGLEELAGSIREDFLSQLNSWVSLHRTPVFLTCSRECFREIQLELRFDTAVSILPLSGEQVLRYLGELGAELGNEELRRAFNALVEPLKTRADGWRTPSVMSLLLETVRSATYNTRAGHETRAELVHSEVHSSEPTALRVGDRLLADGDLKGAETAYKEALEAVTDPAPIALRLSLVLQLQGHSDEARQRFLESLSLRLEESVSRSSLPDNLSDDERDVLKAIAGSVGYDATQISVRAEVPLSEARHALSGLQERGLVEVVSDQSGRSRYRLFSDDISHLMALS